MATKRKAFLVSKENFPPEAAAEGRIHLFRDQERAQRRPKHGLSPTVHEGPRPDSGGNIVVAAMRDRWEKHQCCAEAKEPLTRFRDSPTLIQLQAGAHGEEDIRGRAVSAKHREGGSVAAAQRVLAQKHYEAKSRRAGISGVGGGVSLWPAMDDMRLSRSDSFRLVLVCALCVIGTASVFHSTHGTHIRKLQQYSSLLQYFHSLHPLSVSDQELFSRQLVVWHQDLLQLMASVHRDFDVVWRHCSLFDVAFLLLYIVGIFVLLYFLIDNMFSKTRLTPHRIKLWVSLLCVVATWTLLSVYLLVCAQAVESTSQETVLSLGSQLASLAQSSLDLTRYHDVLLYWRMELLPPTSQGVLSIMGLAQVRDVTYYLQYYSLPILTALCTPVIKIVLSLRAVYTSR